MSRHNSTISKLDRLIVCKKQLQAELRDLNLSIKEELQKKSKRKIDKDINKETNSMDEYGVGSIYYKDDLSDCFDI